MCVPRRIQEETEGYRRRLRDTGGGGTGGDRGRQKETGGYRGGYTNRW